jgi:diadenosine tetraphosphate (Ap4A) HIT family hydrolase
VTTSTCVLCEADGGTLVWRDAFCRVVLPQEAGYPGFVRVIANAHVVEMTDLSDAQREQLMAVVWTAERVVREVMRPAKVNVASLGNVVSHVHWHVIARYAQDAHFPGSVWSAAQRDVSASLLADWKQRASGLAAALNKALS